MASKKSTVCLVCAGRFDPKLTYEGRPGGRGRRMCNHRCRRIYARLGSYDAGRLARLRNRAWGGVLTTATGTGPVVHAVTHAGDQGDRWSACALHGRFIPVHEWTSWAETPGHRCPDCVALVPIQALEST